MAESTSNNPLCTEDQREEYTMFKNHPVPAPTVEEIADISKRLNYTLSDDDLQQCHGLMKGALQAFTRLDHLVEPTLPVKYPRTPGYRPSAEENTYNAWYWKTDISGAKFGKLSGKRIAIKDSVMVAGVPMANGCRALEGMIPEVDATVVTRMLDAGANIAGKASCECLCFSGCSFTTGYAPVLNPHDATRSAGGSSSGSAVLVTTDQVDMAIGGDQGGSIRLPASWTGCVGFKPTWGLIPYTGAMGMEPTRDHLGPMARTVHDCALMLEVIAGYDDGLDHRQPPNIEVPEYSKEIEGDNLNGINIGILQEGFDQDISQQEVDTVVRKAAWRLRDMGAKVEEVSIPLFNNNQGIGHKGFYSSHNMKLTGEALKHDTKHLSPTFKLTMITGAYLNENFHGQYYARGQNLSRLLRKAFNEALTKYDVLILPTIPFIAQKLPTGTHLPFEDFVNTSQSMLRNTMAANVTGHPALSINAGYSKTNNLPIGMMIVGRHWDEVMVLKVARAHEKLGE